MMMSAGGHLQLTFETIPSSPHYSRGFAAAFQFVSGSYKESLFVQIMYRSGKLPQKAYAGHALHRSELDSDCGFLTTTCCTRLTDCSI